MLKSFLVPVDGSEYSAGAVGYAAALAGREGARITLLNVVDVRSLEGPFLADLSGSIGITPFLDFQKRVRAALEEKATVLREKYVEFLRKVNEAEMAQTLESAQYGARVSVLDRAQPPTEPMRSRMKLALIGLVGCLGLACGLGVGIEFLDPVMVDAAQVESMTGLPVLGAVSKLS